MKTATILPWTTVLLFMGACATAPAPHEAPDALENLETTAPETGSTGSEQASPQEDYSPSGLFHSAHGDFFAKMERYKPTVSASFRMLPDAQLDGERGHFDLYNFNGEGKVPIVIDPDSVLLFGAHTDTRIYEFDGMGISDETVYGVGLHLGYGRFFDDETYVEGVFSPGIYSDFDEGLTSNDWEWFGRGLLTHKYRDDLFLKVGAEVSQVFDDLPVYPLLGVSWLFHPEWRIDVLAPLEAEISYAMSAATTVFLGIDVEGNRYNVNTGNSDFYLQAQEINLYVGGIHRFSDHLSAFTRLGGVVGGDNKFRMPNGGKVQGQMDPTLMFEVGIGWDF